MFISWGKCTFLMFKFWVSIFKCLVDTAAYNIWLCSVKDSIIYIIAFFFLNSSKHFKKRSSEKSTPMKLWLRSEPAWHEFTCWIFYCNHVCGRQWHQLQESLPLKGSKFPNVNVSVLDKGFTQLENVGFKKNLKIKVGQL